MRIIMIIWNYNKKDTSLLKALMIITNLNKYFKIHYKEINYFSSMIKRGCQNLKIKTFIKRI